MLLGLTAFSCSSSTDSDGDNGGGNGNGQLSVAEFFGLVPGRTISGFYPYYVRDSLRQFFVSTDAWSFTATIGPKTDYHGDSVFSVLVSVEDMAGVKPYSYTLYLDAKDDGLYWFGGSYCGIEMPLPSEARVVPYPISHGDSWQSTGHAETKIDQCHDTIMADTLNGSVIKLTNVSIRGNIHPEILLLRIPFVDAPAPLGSRDYEVWLAPGTGPVRGLGFWRADSVHAAFTRPKEGWEVSNVTP
jgi:hypothetical protein